MQSICKRTRQMKESRKLRLQLLQMFMSLNPSKKKKICTRRIDWQSNLSLNLHQRSITLAKRRDYTLVRLYYGGTKTSHLEEEYTKLAHTFSRPRFLTFHLFTMLNHASHYHPPLLPSLRSRVLFLLFILFA